MTQAFVVSSGPNGLVAAVTLARAGYAVTVVEAQSTVGGGARSAELTVPGLIHDHCAAIHPLAMENPLLRSLNSDDGVGLEWLWPRVQCAHPLFRGARGGAALYRDVHATAQQFPTAHDRFWWERLFRPLASNFTKLASDILQPPLRLAQRQTDGHRWGAVSYTHLTLPTKRTV